MRRRATLFVLVLLVALIGSSWWQDARETRPRVVGRAVPMATTRGDLQRAIEVLTARLEADPGDGESAVRLAEVLLRQHRVDGNPHAAVAAEQHLRGFLERHPSHYEAHRMLGAVLLSQHRFREAAAQAGRARAMDPRDAFNYGVLGDASLELGDYEAGFAAIDTMNALRPGPAAYARAAHVLELKGDLDGALRVLGMAADGTSAHDAEAQAWHDAQIGTLLLTLGRLGEAHRRFERALVTFPGHPYGVFGLVRVKLAERDYRAAKALLDGLLARTPSPEAAFLAGDVYAALGAAARAEALYDEGERLERESWATEEPQPQALARFLAERGRKIADAVQLAERAAASRRDIHTMDALAWALFQAGRIDEARRASDAALVTGARDARILQHAAHIRERQGRAAEARALRARIAAPLPEMTLLGGAMRSP